MGASNQTDLGPWSADDLIGTARMGTGLGADSDLPDDVRFLAGVVKLIRQRIAMEGAQTDPARPAVFLLEPVIPNCRLDVAPKRVPMLDNGLTAVTGRLWFVSPVVVTGKYIDIEACDDDELFLVVTDILQLGDVPAVIFDPRTRVPEARFYRNGLGDPNKYDAVKVNDADVSLTRVFEAIDRVYKTCLITPDVHQVKSGRLWQDSKRCWVSEQAEDIVQFSLRSGLAGAFPTCTIRHEQTSMPGRLDIEIEESCPLDYSITRHAVLELKVLRSFGSTGRPVSDQVTLDWVEDGVKQAATYRDERGAIASALCCFDMRPVDTGERCFDHVATKATELKVVLKRWFIYGTSKQYRDAVTAFR